MATNPSAILNASMNLLDPVRARLEFETALANLSLFPRPRDDTLAGLVSEINVFARAYFAAIVIPVLPYVPGYTSDQVRAACANQFVRRILDAAVFNDHVQVGNILVVTPRMAITHQPFELRTIHLYRPACGSNPVARAFSVPGWRVRVGKTRDFHQAAKDVWMFIYVNKSGKWVTRLYDHETRWGQGNIIGVEDIDITTVSYGFDTTSWKHSACSDWVSVFGQPRVLDAVRP